VAETAVENNLPDADQRAQPSGPPAGPVTEPERAVTLDAIRGLAIVGVLAAILAGATIWLLLTNRVMVAGAMDSGHAALVTQALTDAIGRAVQALIRWR
jgi:uncharacterized membrane protein YeiB